MSALSIQHPASFARGRVRSRFSGARRGVSLLELVVVMAIAAVLAAIAMPRVSGSMFRQRALAAAKRMASDLIYARADAIASSTARRVYFSTGRGMYALRDCGNPLSHTPAPYVVSLATGPYQGSLAGASFGNDVGVTYSFTATPEAAAQVVFDGYGVPDSAGWAAVMAGDARYLVALDAAGQVTLGPISAAALTQLQADGIVPSGLTPGGV